MERKGPVTLMKEDLEKKEAQLKELRDEYLRTLAEWDNYRKRMENEFAEFKKYAKVDFLTKILPVLDNFDRALAGAELNPDFDSFFKGIQIIERQLREVLKSMGLVEYSGLGEQFDPTLHEAVGIVTTNDHPENTIIEEISKGYKVGDRVIKPAKVLVSKPDEKGGQENVQNNRN
jgi:molecular chaperone GrpE|uniref:Protein GrpE n=1 Tax=candidate division WOR-3 bacterium TaxID=2052148 RepID=A0A7C4X8D7_UNCW3